MFITQDSNSMFFFPLLSFQHLFFELWTTVEDKHSSDASSLLPQNILSQTSRHNDKDYRLPRAETHSSSTPVVHQTTTPSTVPSSPFALQSDHQPKKSFDANGASTLSKLPTPTASVPAQKTERKGMLLLLDTARWIIVCNILSFGSSKILIINSFSVF